MNKVVLVLISVIKYAQVLNDLDNLRLDDIDLRKRYILWQKWFVIKDG